MPYLKRIVQCINDDMKNSDFMQGNPFQSSFFGGIARSVTFTSTNDTATVTLTKPVEFDGSKEINHLPNDVHPIQLYHKVNGITYEDTDKDSFGDTIDVKEIASMTMIVFADEIRTGLSMEDLAHRLAVMIPTNIDAARVCKDDIKKIRIDINSVNTNSEAVFNGETGLGEYRLRPQSIYFALNYTIESISIKNCYACT